MGRRRKRPRPAAAPHDHGRPDLDGRPKDASSGLLSLVPGSGPGELTQAIAALALYMVVGVFAYSFFIGSRGLSPLGEHVVDALYFTVVTMTTVGYGDLHPKTTAGKLFTCAFVFAGLAVVDLFLATAVNHIMDRQEDYVELALHHEQEGGACNAHEDHSRKAWRRYQMAMVQLVLILVFGVAILCWVEGMDLVDAVYCACVTVTTVGYGDQSFRTLGGRVFAIAWILASTLVLGYVFVTLADARVSRRQERLHRAVLERATTGGDLEAADLDHDGEVGVAEFVLFKLKEMGKVEQGDVDEIIEEFKQLDVSHDGRLDLEDLQRLQKSSGE